MVVSFNVRRKLSESKDFKVFGADFLPVQFEQSLQIHACLSFMKRLKNTTLICKEVEFFNFQLIKANYYIYRTFYSPLIYCYGLIFG